MKLFLFILTILFSTTTHAESPAPETMPAAQISAADKASIYKADIGKIETYLNSINTLIAPFEQEDSEGGKASGTFYLARPGRLRWEYNPPTPILIVAKGSLVAYQDKELDEISHISLDDTLAGFLTRKRISFGEDGVKVLEFSKRSGEISVTIAQNEREDDGNLTMVFTSPKLDLARMQVIDAIGKLTIIEFTTVIYDKEIDKQLFALPHK